MKQIRLAEITELETVLLTCELLTRCECNDAKCINCGTHSAIQQALFMLDHIAHQP